MAAALSSAVSASPRSQRRAHTLPLRSNSACCCSCLDAGKSRFPSQKCRLPVRRPRILRRPGSVFSRGLSEALPRTTNYEFSDGVAEVELRLDLVATNVRSSRDIVVDVDESSLRVRTQNSGSLVIIFETSHLYEKIKPSETIWFIDEEQLVINLKKYYINLQWPDIMETWESLTRGLVQLLKGTSIYIVGESTEINEMVAGALAAGLGYTPLSTGELLETYAQQSLDAWLIAEGEDSVAEAERSVIESLSRHVRAVVATLGGQHGNARRADKWRHLYAGFTIWLSQTEAVDDASAKEEARKHIEYGCVGYSNADVVVKFGGWESDGAQTIAQACLSALKRLIISDKELTGKKSLYIRLGCRGDWPYIKPPGWDPSTGQDVRMGI